MIHVLKILRENKELVVTCPNIENIIVLDELRNIVLDEIPYYLYDSKSRILVRMEYIILDDILYNVFGIYYVDNAYLALTEIEEAG